MSISLETLSYRFARLHYKFDGSSLLVFDDELNEFWHKSDSNAVFLEIPGRQYKSLHSVVDCRRANGLHFCPVMFTAGLSNGTGHSRNMCIGTNFY